MLAGCAQQGRDKLTLIASEPVASVGLWIEQLIAESTGKEGKGILPVAGEPLGSPENYDHDRLFAYIHVEPDPAIEGKLKPFGEPTAIRSSGTSWSRRSISERNSISGSLPPRSPALCSASIPSISPTCRSRRTTPGGCWRSSTKMARFRKTFPASPAFRWPSGVGPEQEKALEAFVQQVRPRDYISIQQYLPESAETNAQIQRLQLALRNPLRVAVTTGYGPRFLHSTGQFHKGGPPTGVFLQITAGETNELPIPGEKAGFAVLAEAQALGDLLSLAQHKRRVLAVRLGASPQRDLDALTRTLQRLLEAKPVSI